MAKSRSSDLRLPKTSTRPRVAVGDPWDDLKVETHHEPNRKQFQVLICTLIPALLIFVVLAIFALMTDDKEHINDAWALTTHAVCTALGWAAGRWAT